MANPSMDSSQDREPAYKSVSQITPEAGLETLGSWLNSVMDFHILPSERTDDVRTVRAILIAVSSPSSGVIHLDLEVFQRMREGAYEMEEVNREALSVKFFGVDHFIHAIPVDNYPGLIYETLAAIDHNQRRLFTALSPKSTCDFFAPVELSEEEIKLDAVCRRIRELWQEGHRTESEG